MRIRGALAPATILISILALCGEKCRADPVPRYSDQALVEGLRAKALSERQLKGRRIAVTGIPVEVGSGAILFAPQGSGTKIRADLEPGGLASGIRVGVRTQLECTFSGKKTFGPVVLESCIDLGPAATAKNLLEESLARRREAEEAAAEGDKPSPLAEPGSTGEIAATPLEPAEPLSPEARVRDRPEWQNFKSLDHGMLFFIGVLVVLIALMAGVNWALSAYVGYLEEAFGYRFWTGRLVLLFGGVGLVLAHIGLDLPIGASWALLAAGALVAVVLVLNVGEVGLLHGTLVTALQVLAGMTLVAALFALMGLISRLTRRDRT